MTTIQQLIDILHQAEDKSQTVVFNCNGVWLEIGEVTSDCEGVYLEPEEK